MRRLLKITAVAALLTGGLALGATGQYQVQNGRVLDRNLQRGSGGLNPVQRPQNYGRAADAIVTGRSGGLSAFRGFIDYGAAGEFRGELSTDDLFNIERRSMPMTQDMLSRGPSNSLSTIFRRETSYTSGDVTGQWGYSEDLSIYRTTPGVGDIRGSGTSMFGYTRMPRTEHIGLATSSDGRVLELNASPLTGVTYRDLSMRMRELEAQRQGRLLARPTPYGAQLTRPGQLDSQSTRQQRPGIGQQPAQVDADAQADAQAETERRQPGLLLQGRLGQRMEGVVMNPGIMLGQQMDDRIRAQAVGQFDPALIQRQLLEPTLARNVEPGQDPYIDLINNIRKQQGLDPLQQPDQQIKREAPDQPGESDQEPGKTDIDDLIRPDRPDIPTLPEQTPTEKEDLEAKIQDPTEPVNPATFEDLVKGLKYDMEPMASMAGKARTAFNEAMRNAERRMSEGKYFQAATDYRTALALRPDYPLARVGLMHAQLAAGMYRSAAHSMRNVFAKHPQLIAARYTQPLLPGTARMSQLKDQLLKLMDDESQLDAPLLMAYLAYQGGDTARVEEYLNKLAERAPRDPLVRLARQIWLKPRIIAPQEGDKPKAEPAPNSNKPGQSSKPDASRPSDKPSTDEAIKDLGGVLDK